MDAQLQTAVLNHVNTVVSVTRSEESLSLVQIDQQHVTTQLQEDGLLEVAEHPGYNMWTHGEVISPLIVTLLYNSHRVMYICLVKEELPKLKNIFGNVLKKGSTDYKNTLRWVVIM